MTRFPIVLLTVGLLCVSSSWATIDQFTDLDLGSFELESLTDLWNFDVSQLAETIGINITQVQIDCALCVGNCSTFTTFDVQICMGECSACPPIAPPTRYDYSSMMTAINEPACTAGYAPTPVLGELEANRDKKNIIVFMMDDLDVTTTPFFSAMPFAKRLFVDNGVHFENAFTSTSICCAARCQFLTGLYGHNVGIVGNGGMYGGWNAFVKPLDAATGARQKDEQGRCINNEDRTVAKFLHDFAGYKTAIFGKLMNGIENETSHVIQKVMPGWTQFDVAGDRAFYSGYAYSLSDYNEDDDNFRMKYYGLKTKDYVTDVLTLKALKFLARYRNDPMFIYLGNAAPHFPIAAAPRHRGLQYNWANSFDQYVTSRPNYRQLTNESVPTWFQATRNGRMNVLNSPWIQTEWVKRMGSLYAVDDMIRATYQTVSALGLLDDTVFVLVGDNGYNLGSHQLIHKQAPYEECIRIPLYMSGEGLRKGVTVSSKAMLMDLLPTFLDFANLEKPDYIDGISLYEQVIEDGTPIEYEREMYLQYRHWTQLQGDGPGIATEFLPSIMYSAPPGFALDVPPYHGIRTEQYLYIEWDYRGMNLTNPQAAVSMELYDVEADPHQLINIAYRPENAALVTELHNNMISLGECSGCECHPRSLPSYCGN